jgi:hypothetical protein
MLAGPRYNDPDAGYTMSLWENEEAMRAYESSDILQKTTWSHQSTARRISAKGVAAELFRKELIFQARTVCKARLVFCQPAVGTCSLWCVGR